MSETQPEIKQGLTIDQVIHSAIVGKPPEEGFQILMSVAEACVTTAFGRASDEDFKNGIEVLKKNVAAQRDFMKKIAIHAENINVDPVRFQQALGLASQVLSTKNVVKEGESFPLSPNSEVNIFFEDGDWQGLLIFDGDATKSINLKLPEFIPAVAKLERV